MMSTPNETTQSANEAEKQMMKHLPTETQAEKSSSDIEKAIRATLALDIELPTDFSNINMPTKSG